ncbi:putative C30D11.11-like protein [Cladobotryum mycophilum]|uniref:C30D11.11-like protein n=1 Tax=Cladobotryum mycophilum TaxID=491253 RepID=A0ABR0SVD5_9HYPO
MSMAQPPKRQLQTTASQRHSDPPVDIDIDSKDFHKAVNLALKVSEANGGWLTYEEIPSPWRNNHFIRRGYRFTPSLIKTALSLFYLSNETINIWTHLIPVFLVLRYPLCIIPVFETFRDGGLGRSLDAYVALTYFVTGAASMICSSAWHSARCSSRVRLMSSFVSVDIMSISLILTAFNILFLHVAFYQQPYIRGGYIMSSLVWLIAGLLLPWTNAFRPANIAPWKIVPTTWPLARSWNRVLFFSGLGAQGIVLPALHSLRLNGWEQTAEIYDFVWPVSVPIFVGALVYATKFPERLWPGRFDFIGCSHNIWHVMTAITCLNGCRVMHDMFEVAWRRAS